MPQMAQKSVVVRVDGRFRLGQKLGSGSFGMTIMFITYASKFESR
jgi:hypothetical protein